jgi:hypothetical protein
LTLAFFFSTFSGVSRQGEFKNTTHHGHIFAKSPCRKPFPKKSTKISMSVFPRLFFCFIAFSGVSQRWEFKNTTKNVLQKNRVEKFLQKIRPKIQNQFSPGFVLSRCWAFLGEGSSTARLKNIKKINLTPSFFRTLTHPPTHHGGHRFFLPAPWRASGGGAGTRRRMSFKPP